MKHLPVRMSLVTQVVDLARRNIRSGLWKEYLPGQRALAEELQVSRPTLQLATDVLRKEGVISGEPGRRIRILRRPRASRSASRSEVVGFLSPVPLNNLTPQSLFVLSDLQRHLSDAGFHLSIHTERCFAASHPHAALDRLVREIRAAAWVLHVGTLEIQSWFAERGIPAILSKRRHEGVALPSLDLDHEAMGRHAGGVLYGLGHRRVVYLRAPVQDAGRQRLEKGLKEGLACSMKDDTAFHALVVMHPPKSASHPLLALFSQQPRPTAVVCSDAASTVGALGVFAAAGLRVPHDFSVLCCFDDPLLPFCFPSVARYRMNWASYSRRFAHLVIRLARTGYLPARQTLVVPEFIKGDTLGRAP